MFMLFIVLKEALQASLLGKTFFLLASCFLPALSVFMEKDVRKMNMMKH